MTVFLTDDEVIHTARGLACGWLTEPIHWPPYADPKTTVTEEISSGSAERIRQRVADADPGAVVASGADHASIFNFCFAICACTGHCTQRSTYPLRDALLRILQADLRYIYTAHATAHEEPHDQ